MKPGEVGIVVVPFVFVLVMVVRYSVRVVVTVKAVVYVGTAETLVLPSCVVQDLAWTMGYLLWKSKRKERNEGPCRNNMMTARPPVTSMKIRCKGGSNRDVPLFIPRHFSHYGVQVRSESLFSDNDLFQAILGERETRPEYRHEPGRRWLASPQLNLLVNRPTHLAIPKLSAGWPLGYEYVWEGSGEVAHYPYTGIAGRRKYLLHSTVFSGSTCSSLRYASRPCKAQKEERTRKNVVFRVGILEAKKRAER